MTAARAWLAVALAGVIEMNDYQVTLEFSKPPAFSMVIQAASESDARETAKRFAPEYGFSAKAKKIIVRHHQIEKEEA